VVDEAKWMNPPKRAMQTRGEQTKSLIWFVRRKKPNAVAEVTEMSAASGGKSDS